MIYSLTGFMACGKSTVGRILASELSAHFIDLDEFIAEQEGRSISDIFRFEGEAAFREIEYQNLLKIINEATDTVVLSLGGGAFIFEKTRKLILEKTESFYLKTDLITIMKRLDKDLTERPLASNAESLFHKREPIYALSAHTIDTTNLSAEEVAERINEMIR